MSGDISKDDAMMAQTKLVRDLNDSVQFSSTGQNRINSHLVNWVHAWLKREENLQRGSAVTTLLRMGGVWWPQVAKVLMGTSPYPSTAMYLSLRNASQAHIDVTVNLEHRATPVKSKYGWVDGATYRGVPQIERLAPGESTKVELNWAILALQQYSRDAWDPMLWEESGAIPRRNDLVEVGYHATISGQQLDSDTYRPQQQKKRKHDDR